MRVLLMNPSFRLEQGGPAYSVGRLGGALAEIGAQVTLWAPDGSANQALALDATGRVEGASGPIGALMAQQRWDVVHDNGLWLPYGAAVARHCTASAIPRLLSVRGMMQPWAWAHRRWKKMLAWPLYQRRAVMSANGLHATADDERACIVDRLPGRRPFVIPNGIDVPDAVERRNTQADAPRTALFLGRIHPVKGLPMLIDAWAAVRPDGWRLRLVGPGDPAYVTELRDQLASAALDNVVSIDGPVRGPDKQATFADAALFILPSYTENFGISIAEALASSLPVITTTGTPWPMLQSERAGWWVAPEADAIAAALRQAVAAPPAELAAMGARGRDWVTSHLHWPAIAKQFTDAYATLLNSPHTKF